MTQTHTKRVVVLISGSGSNLQSIIDQANTPTSSYEVVGVISNKPDAYGLERAKQAHIPALSVDHKTFADRELFDQALFEKITSLEPDIVVLAGFMRILTPLIIQHFSGRLINIHPSLLPKYKGLHTHKRALEAKDKEHGCSVHFVTEDLDGGPIIMQATLPVEANDDEASLAKKVLGFEHQVYPLALSWLTQGRLALDAKSVSLDGKLLPETGYAFSEDSRASVNITKYEPSSS